MNALFLILALVGGDDGFQWAVDAPSFTWAVEGGASSSLPADSGSTAHDAPALPHDAESVGTDAQHTTVCRCGGVDRRKECSCINRCRCTGYVSLGDSEPSPADSGAPATSPESASQYVHRLAIGNVVGSCVSIGDGWFVTCLHVLNGSRGNVVIDGTDGGPARSVQWGDTLRDVAVFRCNVILPGATFGTTLPAHGAEAVVVGLPGIGTEKQTSTGIVADWDMVSLGANEPEIKQGQSGGAVFVAGNLVGILRGYTQEYQGLPANPRAAKFTPLFQVSHLFGPQAASQQSTKGHWETRRVCHGNYCTTEQVWVAE